MTLRLYAVTGDLLRAIARIEGKSQSDVVREAIEAHIAERRKDAKFRERLRLTMRENQEILDRLGGNRG